MKQKKKVVSPLKKKTIKKIKPVKSRQKFSKKLIIGIGILFISLFIIVIFSGQRQNFNGDAAQIAITPTFGIFGPCQTNNTCPTGSPTGGGQQISIAPGTSGTPQTSINPSNAASNPCIAAKDAQTTTMSRRHGGSQGGFLQLILQFFQMLLQLLQQLLGGGGNTTTPGGPLPTLGVQPSGTPNANPSPCPTTSSAPQPSAGNVSGQPTSAVSAAPSAAPTGSTATNPMPVGVSGTWKIVFDDEFNSSSVNTTYWNTTWFNGGTMNGVSTSASNVSESGGNLILTLASGSSGALVSTNPSGGSASTGFTFGTGYFAEARIYFSGNGSSIYNWPAFWTDGQSWPTTGESDIAEVLGGNLTSNYHSPQGANNGGSQGGSWGNGWHTYALDRESGTDTIYWDGKVIRSYSSNDGGAPQYLIFNVGDGGTSAYGTTSQVKVDYVRVWQK